MRLLRSRPDRVNKDNVQASLPKARLSERAKACKLKSMGKSKSKAPQILYTSFHLARIGQSL